MKKGINVQLDLDLINNAASNNPVSKLRKDSKASLGDFSSDENTFMSFTVINDFELDPTSDASCAERPNGPVKRQNGQEGIQRTSGTKRQSGKKQLGGSEKESFKGNHSIFRTSSMQYGENSLSLKFYGPMVKPEGKPYPATTMARNQKTFDFGPGHGSGSGSVIQNHMEQENRNSISSTSKSFSNKQKGKGVLENQESLREKQETQNENKGKNQNSQTSFFHFENPAKNKKSSHQENEETSSFRRKKQPTPLKGTIVQSARENIMGKTTPKNGSFKSKLHHESKKERPATTTHKEQQNGFFKREKSPTQMSVFASMDSGEGTSKKVSRQQVLSKEAITLATSFFMKSSKKNQGTPNRKEEGSSSHGKSLHYSSKKAPGHTISVHEPLNQTKEKIKENKPRGLLSEKKKSQKSQVPHEKKLMETSLFFQQMALKFSMRTNSSKSTDKNKGGWPNSSAKNSNLAHGHFEKEEVQGTKAGKPEINLAMTPHKEPKSLHEFLKIREKNNSESKKKDSGQKQKTKKITKMKIPVINKKENEKICHSKDSIQINTPKKPPANRLGLGSAPPTLLNHFA